MEDDLEESEMEGLIDTPEIIGPSPETFAQLPLPSTRPSSIPHPSPSPGPAPPSTPPHPPTPQPPPPPLHRAQHRRTKWDKSSIASFRLVQPTPPTTTAH